MKNRIIICADVVFPRGGAGANRVCYIAKSLQTVGYEVVVLAYPNFKFCESSGKSDMELVEGIKFYKVHISKNKYINYFQQKLPMGNGFLRTLDKLQPCSDDVVLIYGSSSLFVEHIYKHCHKKNIPVAVDVVEWHQPYQYKFGKMDIRYISNARTFEKVSPRIKNIISISNVITDYYKKHGCTNILQLPATVEITESEENLSVKNGIVNLIYPGNPQGKDDVLLMLRSIKKLTLEEREKIRFHFTSVKPKTIRELLSKEAFILDELGDCVCFHDWLSYEELIELYRNMDFLYQIRLDTLVTQANFPSKLPELMACGVVPIGNKVGDYYNYLSPENSILIDNNSVDDCVQALRNAINIKESNMMLAYKKAAYNCARDCFDYKIWADRTAEFFERCVN